MEQGCRFNKCVSIVFRNKNALVDSGGQINYLNKGLKVMIMHQLLQKNYAVGRQVAYPAYYRFFMENCKLYFGRPQFDVCSACEKLNIKETHKKNSSIPTNDQQKKK